MARDTTDNTPLENYDQLVHALSDGCKPKDEWRIGTEHEKFAYYRSDFSPVPYEGDRGIKALLEGMQAKTGWEPIVDAGNIIGLVAHDGMGAISLEPGGQFELSGAPLETIHETCRESNKHLRQVQEVADELGMGFLGLGGSPKWTFAETPQMPKSRYDIMRAYMPKVGTQGLDMMHRTCTIQVNLDFGSEDDMRRKMQVSTKLQAVASALFANSPFTDGKPNGLLSWRSDIWRDTDNQRAGLHEFVLEPDFGFAKYVDWALSCPMYFISRDGVYRDCTHITFQQFLDGALEGEVPNEGDWQNHISTLFPDVRLKKFIEMRGADGGPWRRICALPAFWVGLLYDDAALDEAEALCADLDYDAVRAMREAVPAKGLAAPAGKRTVLDVAKDAMAIAHRGLNARNRLNQSGVNETHFLGPLDEVVALKETQAERLLKQFRSNWDSDIDHIFEEYGY
ncbi:glutamate--cysteine ligase [Ahrensia sp. R2A130]|uniref:glutamate--cysteine ligase n=1 Tax=Ahrensia sp. R2A130 TaxID=744979 RepID=UPI0001E08C68|nr:glutamate--cysteine ligase [Ahrensia sp. R2A130]EFL88530.1 glutamate--cysteine ligase [Ahrensia sp. R2A130]